jgi:hypothetical protein
MPRLTKDTKAQIAKMLADDKSPTEIAKELGVARSSIYRVVKDTKTATPEHSDNESNGSNDDDDDDDNGSEPDGVVGNFFKNSVQFAADLGLQADTTKNEDEAPPNTKAAQKLEQIKRMEEVQRRRIESELLGDNSPRLEVQEVDVPTAATLRKQQLPPQFASQFAMLSDPDFDRGQVIQQIMFNVEHFAPMLRKIIGNDEEAFVQSLPQRNDRELEGLLSVIDRTRSVGNMATTMKHTFYMAATGAEVVSSSFLNMRTGGYVEALRAQDTEITMAIKELAIENYNKFSKMNRPEMRLGMLAVMTLIQVDSQARIREAMGTQNIPPVKPDLQQKYEDL